MRHRRRISTQTIRKKNYTSTIRPVSKEKSHFARNFFLFILVAGILGVGGYFGYTKLWPVLQVQIEEFNKKQQVEQALAYGDEDVLEQSTPSDQPLEQVFPIQNRIQIEVLNGCGEQGIAKVLSRELKTHDYDVVNSGNYLERGQENFNVASTKIIDNNANATARARDLADIMGVDYQYIESFENPAPIADFTVVIGKDFKNLDIFSNR